MDIQLEKNRLIKEFEQLNDIDLIKAIKSLLEYSRKNKTTVPEWHKEIVRKRLVDAKAHPENLLSWDDVMDELRN